MNKIIEELRRIQLLLTCQKEMLNLEEFCSYTGFSKQHAYHLTSNGKIKFYRPSGKMIYFRLDEVNEFLMQNPVKPTKKAA
ncbi:helix-turn-helix domain-containing protein [Flaviaesturariibacter terrae]